MTKPITPDNQIEINKEIFIKIFNGCLHQWERKDARHTFNKFLCVKCNTSDWMQRTAHIPDYSSSYDDAFKVVEKLREKWFALNDTETDYWQIIDCTTEYGWRVEINFGHHDGDANEHSVVDKSLPMAICRAALQAIGNKQKAIK